MTVDRNALAALIEAVERGHLSKMTSLSVTDIWPDRDDYLMLGEAVWRASNGSLDAAKALHEALTPYPDVDIQYRLFGGLCDVTIYDVPGGSVTATSTNLARAWLLAILRAIAAEGGE